MSYEANQTVIISLLSLAHEDEEPNNMRLFGPSVCKLLGGVLFTENGIPSRRLLFLL